MNGRRKQLKNGGGTEKSVLLPVSSVSRLNNLGAPPPLKPIRKSSSEDRVKHHGSHEEKRRRSKTLRKKGDRHSTKKLISKSKENRTSKAARKDSSDKKRKYPKKPPPLEPGSEGKNAVSSKPKQQPSASCADCKTHDSDLDQESLLKNKKKKNINNEMMVPKVSAAQPDRNNNPTAKASMEDDETLISVDTDMPELALPTYVLPEGEFEDPDPIGNSSKISKKHRHTKE